MTQSNHLVMRIDGHQIAYAQQGEGSPLVLIHGIPTSHLLWRNATFLEEQEDSAKSTMSEAFS